MNRFQVKLINDAIDQPHNLTDWEKDFIESISKRDGRSELSSKENSILNTIGSKIR